MSKHIEAARMIVADSNNFPPSLVALAIRVLRQHEPETVKVRAVQ